MSIYSKIMGVVFIFALKATPSVSQLPVTQVFCFDIDRDGAGLVVKNARFLTAFNPQGYNNQPQWVNNNELYIAIQTPNDTNQTEVLSLSVLNNTLTRITATAESEYSPTVMPDRRSFSCVRTDADGSGTQRLWSYPFDRSNSGRDLMTLQQNVGYHCWLSDKKVALFIVDGQHNYLKIASVEDQSSIQLMKDIGRSMARMGDGKLAYIQKGTSPWLIKALDPVSYNSTDVIETLPGSEDFTLMADGTFLMAHGAKLYAYNASDTTKEWRELDDLTRFGVTNIKRLAISRNMDKIAIVNDMTIR
jgi:hypothetical protein